MRIWPRHPDAGALVLAAMFLAGCQGGGEPASLRVLSMDVAREPGAVVLRPELELRLPAPVLEALHNGVPVTVLLEARVQGEGRGPWPVTLASQQRRFVLTYHSLGDQYLVHRGGSGAENTGPRAFPSREAALTTLRSPEPMHLALPDDESGRAGLRVRLELETLPAPLRLVALFSPAWRIGSGWHHERLPP